MTRPKITIAALMGLVFATACAIAVLRYSSPFWFGIVVGVTVFVLLTSIVGAIKGRFRTACLGFAVFGWGSAIVAWGFAMHDAVSNEPYSVRTRPTQTVPQTPLTDLLGTFYADLHHAPPRGVANGVPAPAVRFGVVYAAYQWTGHALACLLFGCSGAIVALIIEAGEGRRDHETATAAPS
jgi:hypothetical protein